jgi:hypothetical protein
MAWLARRRSARGPGRPTRPDDPCARPSRAARARRSRPHGRSPPSNEGRPPGRAWDKGGSGSPYARPRLSARFFACGGRSGARPRCVARARRCRDRTRRRAGAGARGLEPPSNRAGTCRSDALVRSQTLRAIPDHNVDGCAHRRETAMSRPPSDAPKNPTPATTRTCSLTRSRGLLGRRGWRLLGRLGRARLRARAPVGPRLCGGGRMVVCGRLNHGVSALVETAHAALLDQP